MLHLQSCPFQREINCLNWLKFDDDLISSDKEFQRTGAAYLKEFLPYVDVLTLGIFRMLEYLKLYLLSRRCKRSCKTGGESLFTMLKVSMAIVLILLTCRIGSLILLSSSL